MIAVSPSSPSVPWNGAALSPMPWSRPMTGSSARPSGVRSGATMRAFRIRGQYCAILWPPSGPLARRCSRQKGTAAPLEEAVAAAGGWQKLEGVVAAAEQLSDTMSADPLAHVVQGWPRFRRHAPRMLRALEIQASGAGEPILAALRAIGAGSRDMPRTFCESPRTLSQ